MRNKIFIGLLFIVLFVNGASAETFSAEFLETCIGCLDDVAPQADPVVNAISLPAGRVKLTIDTKVSPYRGMGSVSCIGGFLYSDLSADLKAWPNSYTGIVQGNIIESDISPCPEGSEHREHFVTILKLKEPIENFKIVIPPSITYNNLGPKYQYGQKKVITVSWEGAGDCPITGKYAWFNGRIVYIRSDNTIESWFENTKEWYGTWAKSGDLYVLNWRNDAGDSGVDTVTISDDCKSIYGSSSIGFGVGGTRISDISTDGTTVETTNPVPTITETGSTGSVIPTIGTTTGTTINPESTTTGTIDDTSKVISDIWNKASVNNNPSCKPSFTISEPQMITYIDTYHWNYGSGTSRGGTISLKKDDGTIYGPWQVETKSGQGGVPNAWWIVHPNEIIPAGTYTVEDSDVATWSQNQGSNGCGFSKIEGRAYIQTTASQTVTKKETLTSATTVIPKQTSSASTMTDPTSTSKKPPTVSTVTSKQTSIPVSTDIPAPGIFAMISIIFVIYILTRNR